MPRRPKRPAPRASLVLVAAALVAPVVRRFRTTALAQPQVNLADLGNYPLEFQELFVLMGVVPSDVADDASGEPWSRSEAELAARHGDATAKQLMRLDRNRDGVLDLDEFRAAALDLQATRRARHEVAGDEDFDGSLSREELRNAAFEEEEVEEIFLELDKDKDDRVESHEVLELLHEIDADDDGKIEPGEIEAYFRDRRGNGNHHHKRRHSLLERFVKRFQRFAELTPGADVRRMWAVLKDLECVCVAVDPWTEDVYDDVHRPCLLDAQLHAELDAGTPPPKCTFPSTEANTSSRVLTAAEFAQAAAEVLVPIANVTGDLAYADFKAFIQNEPSHATAAITYLIDAHGLAMARSLLVQQIMCVVAGDLDSLRCTKTGTLSRRFSGMGMYFPQLVRDAATARYTLANKQRADRLRVERTATTALHWAWQALFGVFIVAGTAAYLASGYAGATPPSARPAVSKEAAEALAEAELARAYFAGLYERDADVKDEPIAAVVLLTSHCLPALCAAGGASSSSSSPTTKAAFLPNGLWDTALKTGRRDRLRAGSLDRAALCDLARGSIAELNAHRKAGGSSSSARGAPTSGSPSS